MGDSLTVIGLSWLGLGPLKAGITTANFLGLPGGRLTAFVGPGVRDTSREVSSPRYFFGRPGPFLGGFKASNLACSSSR